MIDQLLAGLTSTDPLAADPVAMAEAAGITPDPWQADLLRSTARQVLLLCSRQSGKSTTTAAATLSQALYTPGSLVLILAPAERQSQETLRKVVRFYNALGRPVPAAQESALRLELKNGSRVIALPGKEDATVRGYSDAALLIVDEAARVSDELYMSIRPMLAVSGGRIILLSTPRGKRGFFHHEWTEGSEEWKRVKVTAYDCPRIAPEWLEAERAAIGEFWFSQEYLCEFLDTIDQVFRYEDVMGALSDDVAPLFGGLTNGKHLLLRA